MWVVEGWHTGGLICALGPTSGWKMRDFRNRYLITGLKKKGLNSVSSVKSARGNLEAN